MFCIPPSTCSGRELPQRATMNLQAKDINAQIGIGAGNAAKNFLQRQRNTESFGIFY